MDKAQSVKFRLKKTNQWAARLGAGYKNCTLYSKYCTLSFSPFMLYPTP